MRKCEAWFPYNCPDCLAYPILPKGSLRNHGVDDGENVTYNVSLCCFKLNEGGGRACGSESPKTRNLDALKALLETCSGPDETRRDCGIEGRCVSG